MAAKNSREEYIEQYAEYAKDQMRRYGIPASITLAQGIIESASGKSRLAQTANNHFGVKGTYNGNYVLANDDKPNEKFKKYDNVGQSYEDHSKVLMSRHYQPYTKGLSPDNYKDWAVAIKRGGYATAPNYVSTVVGVIEKYDLDKIDKEVMTQMKKEGRKFGVAHNPSIIPTAAKGEAKAEGRVAAPTANLKSTGLNLPKGEYSMPVERKESLFITSPYGERNDPINKGEKSVHHGIDIRTKKDAVLATENNGKVVGVDSRTTTAAGKTVTVEYEREDGSKTHVQYMHLSEINVKVGDTVNAGQKLGVSGATGTRVTGEHLHFGVINISAEGKKVWMNPAAYLSEINQKGNLEKEALHNGKDLLKGYAAGGSAYDKLPTRSEVEAKPEDWMRKLLSSDDAQVGIGGDGLLGKLVKMLLTLLMLSMQFDKMSNEEKMQAISDAVFDKKVDISKLTPNLKSAHIIVNDKGIPVLTINDGKQEFKHELTQNEQNRIASILQSGESDDQKKQKIGNLINGICFTKQAALCYEQIETQQVSQEQSLKR